MFHTTPAPLSKSSITKNINNKKRNTEKQKDFKCECGKSYTTKDSLHNHIRSLKKQRKNENFRFNSFKMASVHNLEDEVEIEIMKIVTHKEKIEKKDEKELKNNTKKERKSTQINSEKDVCSIYENEIWINLLQYFNELQKDFKIISNLDDPFIDKETEIKRILSTIENPNEILKQEFLKLNEENYFQYNKLDLKENELSIKAKIFYSLGDWVSEKWFEIIIKILFQFHNRTSYEIFEKFTSKYMDLTQKMLEFSKLFFKEIQNFIVIEE